MFKKISALWGRLPAELKVAVFYAGALALNELATALLDLQPIDIKVLVRIFVGNIILVFLKESKPRVEAFKNR